VRCEATQFVVAATNQKKVDRIVLSDWSQPCAENGAAYSVLIGCHDDELDRFTAISVYVR